MTIFGRLWKQLEGEPARFWYHVLLAGLIFLFVLGPVAATLEFPSWIVTWATALLLILSILVVGRTRWHFRVSLGLLIPAVVLRLVGADDPSEASGIIALVFGTALMWYVAGSLAGRIFGDSRVSWDSISGAVCVYMLMGFAWSMTYSICNEHLVEPNAFEGLEEPTDDSDREPVNQQLTYFSFVTLTTLGYGDVSPYHPITRMLAVLEAIVGQLFLVIMVARLVALHVAGAGSREASP